MAAFYWTMWVVINTSGIFTPDLRYMQAPMMTKEACTSAGKLVLKNSSKDIAVFCIGSDKGEFFKVEP